MVGWAQLVGWLVGWHLHNEYFSLCLYAGHLFALETDDDALFAGIVCRQLELVSELRLASNRAFNVYVLPPTDGRSVHKQLAVG